ncbi:MAG TPA: AAA family ATPase [Brevefilum sp.]|nr:AAA family ATPase [Brevefilum sp.]HOR18758.1 AAA family ATPase [Brevefilum sp.]HPL68659.1 AAA family ATPase [Brevefilum sp.]
MNNPFILNIRLLGAVEIYSDDRRIKIPRKIERAILYYLAATHRRVSRSTLIDLLWPSAEQVDPRGTLRTALSRLRNRLPDKSLLVTELDQVALDFSRCFVDLVKFTESYQSLHGLLSVFPKNQPLPTQIVNQIRESLSLWRGDQIIQGDDLSDYPELDVWQQALSRGLELQRVSLMKRLADHYQASGQLEIALDLHLHLGRLNYWDIPAHQAVFDILSKLGRHQEAVEYCDALEVIFDRKYQSPLPDEIIICCQRSEHLLNAGSKKENQVWPSSTSMQLPLIGRSAELTQLRRAFFRGGLVMLKGEMGVGKTRLVQELFETLTPKPILLMATATESEITLPFAPIVHMLRRYVPEAALLSMDTVWANQLTLLLPELIELRTDCDPSILQQLPAARQHLLGALHHLLKLVSQQFGRLLLFLDDAHWADLQTYQALSYLLTQGFFDKDGVLMMASSSENPSRYVDEFIDYARRTYPVEIISVIGLTPEDFGTFTHLIIKRPLPAEFFDQLYHETQGNPFMALETLRHVVENYPDIEDLQAVDRFPLPESVHGMIRERLKRLGEAEQHILTCVAIIGNDISLSLLQSVVDIDQDQFLSAIDQLIRSGFLDMTTIPTTNEERLEFTHQKMSEVVFKEATPVYRQQIHQKIADLLSLEPHACDQAAIIADHYISAGDVINAFDWLIKAAEHAWNLGAKEDVLRAYQKAEEILNRAFPGVFGNEKIIQLYHRWSNFAYQSNQVSLLEEVGIKLQHIAEIHTSDSLMGLSSLSLANACFLRGNCDNGLVLIHDAVRHLEKTNDIEILIQTLFCQASLRWWNLGFDAVFASADRMVKLIDALLPEVSHKTQYQFLAQMLAALTYYAKGDADSAMEFSQKIYQTYFNQIGTFDRLLIYHMLTNCNFVAGNIDRSAHFAQEGVAIAQVLDNSFSETLSLINLCKVQIIQAELDEAYHHIIRARKLAEKTHNIYYIVAVNTLLGNIYDILHSNAQAMHYYRLAQIRQGYFLQSYYGLENNVALARLLTRSGQPAEAREILKSTLATTEEKGLMAIYIQALLADGLIDLEAKNFKTTEQKFSTALKLAEQRNLAQEIAWGNFRMAQLAFSRGEFNQAEELLMEILGLSRSLRMKMLNKNALELAGQLSRHIKLRIHPQELRSAYQALLSDFDAYTQSEPLRKEFLHALQVWREENSFS